MAAIDKIYLTPEQYFEFTKWVKSNSRKCKVDTGEKMLKYIYRWDLTSIQLSGMGKTPTSNFPREINEWLLDNCQFKYITDRIKEQYGIQDNLLEV